MWYANLMLAVLSMVQLQSLPQEAQSPAVRAAYPEYRVGPGDQLTVHVFGMSDFDRTVRVSNSGKIHLPYLGIIPVAAMTVAEIEDTIAQALRRRQLVLEPWVQVQVAEYRAQPVFVVGAVNSPGQFMITGAMHLLDVIGKAGGINQDADAKGYLVRRHDFSRPFPDVAAGRAGEAAQDRLPQEEPATGADRDAPAGNEKMVFDLQQLKEGRPDLNVLLQGGDVVYIPRRVQRHIYIVGEVSFPGAYGLPRQYDHITAARAVSYAGGPLRTAKSGRAFIVRHNADGTVRGVPFDFAAILKGRRPDIPIEPDDIIFVPRSVPKTVAFNMLQLVAHLTQQFIIF